MFRNLEAEFVRLRLSPFTAIANVLNCSERTARNRLNKSGFSVFEATKIKEKYFPNMTIDYLFDTTAVDSKSG